ncbi:MAG: DNA polymerase III subunit gamma/tau [Pseudomonadota bacterium]
MAEDASPEDAPDDKTLDLLGGDGGASNHSGADQSAYVVLARKYRPRTFDDLIGQEPMVQTLRNAFITGRVPQAWMLTGVRGVGKTTTARILARALNYHLPGEVEAPTVDMPKLGVHCQAIMESRHVDVIEMDAASHTGIDDIRDITDAARYKPASARFKVYIIDEVHMLSKAAFNGLLKTLEEPPEHVKFIFATTEIRKVPVTILSRCQRFDLRRIEAPVLSEFLAGICDAEDVEAETDALNAIAKAGEGSVRDALSLLDQAIAHGSAKVALDDVADMLGLIDQQSVIDLFEAAMAGDAKAALERLDELYNGGVSPEIIIQDLLAVTHNITQSQIRPNDQQHGVPQHIVARLTDLASRIGIGQLSLAWQVLFGGLEDVKRAGDQKQAADMALIRLIYAGHLPPPEDLAAKAHGGAAASNPSKPAREPKSAPQPAPVAQLPPTTKEPIPAPAAEGSASVSGTEFESFQDVVAHAREQREAMLVTQLERHVRLVSFENGHIELEVLPTAQSTVANDLSAFVKSVTGQRWIVSVVKEGGGATLHQERQDEKARLIEEARARPYVRRVLDYFPGSEIVDVVPGSPPENEIDTSAPAQEKTPKSNA